MSNNAIKSVSNDANKVEKPKRKRKRFYDEAQIIKAIDKCHANAARLKAEAVELERLAKQFSHEVYRLEAEKKRKSAQRWEEVTAKRLGMRLSELRTPNLFPEFDASVPG